MHSGSPKSPTRDLELTPQPREPGRLTFWPRELVAHRYLEQCLQRVSRPRVARVPRARIWAQKVDQQRRRAQGVCGGYGV